MINQLKSEAIKLFTVRSTYVLIAVALFFTALFAYFGTSASTYEVAKCEDTGEVIYSGDNFNPAFQDSSPEEFCSGSVVYSSETSKDLSKDRLVYSLQESVPITITFITIVAILMMAHEFRYNIINYTLTISNGRSKVLTAKLIVISLFTVLATIIAIGITFGSVFLAIAVKDLSLPTQDFNWPYIILRHIIYALGYTLFFVGLATLLRNLTASIATAFVLPTIDGIAGFLLASREIEPTKVLPFSALDRFGSVAVDVTSGGAGGAYVGLGSTQPATAFGGLAVFCLYLVILWLVAWSTFLKRDAN